MNEESKTEKKSGIVKMVGIPTGKKIDASDIDGTSKAMGLDDAKKTFADGRPTRFFLADSEDGLTLFPFTYIPHPSGSMNGVMMQLKSSGNDRTELEDCGNVVGAKVKLVDRYDFRLAAALLTSAVEMAVKEIDENMNALACEGVVYVEDNKSWTALFVPKFVTES